MKKTLIKALSLMCALSMTLSALAACQQKGDDKSKTQNEAEATGIHHVTFNSNGGSTIHPVDVYHDNYLEEPTQPTRENYIFSCWEHNGDKWGFHIKKITEDITLDAVWLPAHEIFKTEPTENKNEILISGFFIEAQKEFELLVIPSVINGKTVVGFTDGAFESIYDSYAHKIVIPKTVTHVGQNAFADIDSVHIEFSGPLTSLSPFAFKDCEHLESITLGEGITVIPNECFYNARSIEVLDIPKGVTTIQENAFYGCSSLSSMFLPSSLTSIEDSAFKGAFQSAKNEILYEGTKEDFEKINIANNNEDLLAAKIYFYSETEPTSEGNYWHYDESNNFKPW